MSVQELEAQLKDVKDIVELRDAALRLHKNRDFRKLIVDGFCEADVARLVRLSVDPGIDAQTKEDAIRMAQAGGYLKRHLSAITQMGNQAANSLPDLEEALQEARAEEDAD